MARYSGADMIRFGLYSNGVYGRLETLDSLKIETAVVEAVAETGMTRKRRVGSAGLYEVTFRGKPESLRFMSQNFDVAPDDIAFFESGNLIAVLHGSKVFVFGHRVRYAVRNSPWGATAWLLSILGVPWFQSMVSNALYQLLTMMPEPVRDSQQVQGCYYMTDFDEWETYDAHFARLKAGRA